MSEVSSPLVISEDANVIDAAHRWCAAVNSAAQVSCSLTAVRRLWRDCPAVLVDAAQVDAVLSWQLSRRDHVVIVHQDSVQQWTGALQLGAMSLRHIADDEAVIADLARALDGSSEACVVSVIGAVGGVGGSTLAAALAMHGAARGTESLVVDGDRTGGGIDLVCGAEHSEGLRWPDLALADGHVSPGSLTRVLPRAGGAAVLSWHREAGVPVSPTAVFAAAVRGFDLMAVDLNRHAAVDRDQLAAEALSRSVAAVVVVPESIRGLVAGEILVDQLTDQVASRLVVTRALRHGVGTSAIARELGVPVLSRLSTDRSLVLATETGLGPSRSRVYRRVCADILDAIGIEPGGAPTAEETPRPGLLTRMRAPVR